MRTKNPVVELLEPYLGRSQYAQPGQRVVTGQRLMQATNDIFLGYAQSLGKDYFIRQLYDMKGSANLEVGKSDSFDKAIVEFALCYAAQNVTDYAAFQRAVKEGRLEARTEAPPETKKRR